MDTINIHNMVNTGKKVWVKPQVRKLSIKNTTMGNKNYSTESNLHSNNGRSGS